MHFLANSVVGTSLYILPPHNVVYTRSEPGMETYIYPDGTLSTPHVDGVETYTYPDDTFSERYLNGTTVYYFMNGTISYDYPNGTSVYHYMNSTYFVKHNSTDHDRYNITGSGQIIDDSSSSGSYDPPPRDSSCWIAFRTGMYSFPTDPEVFRRSRSTYGKSGSFSTVNVTYDSTYCAHYVNRTTDKAFGIQIQTLLDAWLLVTA